jgi:hypothetical protein
LYIGAQSIRSPTISNRTCNEKKTKRRRERDDDRYEEGKKELSTKDEGNGQTPDSPPKWWERHFSRPRLLKDKRERLEDAKYDEHK